MRGRVVKSVFSWQRIEWFGQREVNKEGVMMLLVGCQKTVVRIGVSEGKELRTGVRGW